MKKINEHIGPVLDEVDGYKVVDCKKCQFKHVSPIPTDEELSKLYSESFYRNEKPQYFKDAEEDYDWWILTYKNYYRLLEGLTKGRRLLDIGSGPGYFLKCGQEQGWEVVGFEPSKQAYEYSKEMGLTVVNDFFTPEKAKKFGKFDVVFLSLVLEHIPDPAKLIKDIKKVLSPKGLLFVVSPNDYNPFQKILKDNLKYKPWWVVPQQHINYFDFKSIQQFLKRNDFRISLKQGTFPMEYFLLSGDNYVGNDKIGRACHYKRKVFESNLYLNNPSLINSLYKSLAKEGIGREIVIIAKL